MVFLTYSSLLDEKHRNAIIYGILKDYNYDIDKAGIFKIYNFYYNQPILLIAYINGEKRLE